MSVRATSPELVSVICCGELDVVSCCGREGEASGRERVGCRGGAGAGE